MRKSNAARKECTRCGATLKGAQCTGCGLWNFPKSVKIGGLKTLADVRREKEKVPTIACGEWGKMFSQEGELVLGTLTAIGGSPGAGKSTLLLHIIGELDEKSIYVMAEEGEDPVAQRADRLGIPLEKQGLVTVLEAFGNQEVNLEAAIKATGAKIVFVDSISLLAEDPSTALKDLAIRQKLVLILTVHVTKDGGIAGLMALQHVVDCTMTFFPDENQEGVPRVLHVEKNRNGPAYVSQVYLMTESGLEIISKET